LLRAPQYFCVVDVVDKRQQHHNDTMMMMIVVVAMMDTNLGVGFALCRARDAPRRLVVSVSDQQMEPAVALCFFSTQLTFSSQAVFMAPSAAVSIGA
jgi:hypothetical protein